MSYNKNKNFAKELKRGQKYEKWIANLFQTKNYSINSFGDKNTYDIEMTKNVDNTNKVRLEVKTDSGSFIYYRAGFEIRSFEKRSGIHTTKSKYWVNIFPFMDYVDIYSVELIKKVMKEDNSHILRNCGDYKASKMVLWDWDYFHELFKEKSKEHNLKYCRISTQVPQYYNENENDYILNKRLQYSNSFDNNYRCSEKEIIKKFYNKK